MARRAADAGRPSQRQLRVGEELRHVLAELLTRGHWREPGLAAARFTVSEVRPERLEALQRVAPQLRGEVTRRMRLKYAPDLAFRPDRSFAEAAHIEALLARERAAVGRDEDDDGPG